MDELKNQAEWAVNKAKEALESMKANIEAMPEGEIKTQSLQIFNKLATSKLDPTVLADAQKKAMEMIKKHSNPNSNESA